MPLFALSIDPPLSKLKQVLRSRMQSRGGPAGWADRSLRKLHSGRQLNAISKAIPRLLLTSVLVSAASPALSVTGLECQTFQGTFTLAPDPNCRIVQMPVRQKQFPDATFLAEQGLPGTCFLGSVTGTLGFETVTGTAVSGQIEGALPAPAANLVSFAAATVLRLKDSDNQDLGVLYLRDTGMMNMADYITHEQLVMIGGTRRFAGGRGSLTISGNEFAGAAVSGQICYRPPG